ncbi:Rid family detoxifying hydrolase [Candidatus Acetothermia bacterium]|jgi:2-iminobutanoate/2-iminopropanoate deaminase|nr:Rid family detoxifying hydrolase [Candidatus Acetothermia bacterium]MCI2426280.1 Rid family detoxifying hydrolase [Candidatus Acetothermia bacterium]MCI2427178.1 Rid family detoxifying hydrolase [Candidatus Acetothermia bacterium]MCI2428062.1 Rid family detoxifying hydrolase [Candidatus Acetothermia bacterium]
MKRVISSKAAPPAVGPYSQAILINGFLFTSGQLPADNAGNLIINDIAAATRRSLENVQSILQAAGGNMDQIVKVTIFLTDMKDFAVVNGVYTEFFSGEPPARSCVAVAALPKGAKIEVEAIAYLGG